MYNKVYSQVGEILWAVFSAVEQALSQKLQDLQYLLPSKTYQDCSYFSVDPFNKNLNKKYS